MNRVELDTVQEIFEIAMHSLLTEELILKQEQMDMYRKHAEEESALCTVSYNVDIIRRGEIVSKKRGWLFELFDKCREDKL